MTPPSCPHPQMKMLKAKPIVKLLKPPNELLGSERK
jgi:hypothetical protein